MSVAHHREEWVAIPKDERPAELRPPIAAVLISSEGDLFRLKLEWPDGLSNTTTHGSLTAARREAADFKRLIRERYGAHWTYRARLR